MKHEIHVTVMLAGDDYTLSPNFIHKVLDRKTLKAQDCVLPQGFKCKVPDEMCHAEAWSHPNP